MYPVNKPRIQPSGGGGGALRRLGCLREGKCEAEPLHPHLLSFLFILSSEKGVRGRYGSLRRLHRNK